MGATITNQSFYRKMLSLAIPIAIQSLLISSLNMVDSMMVGQLGVNSIAAVGVANKITMVLILVLQGFGTGAAIFSAQYWGRKNVEGIKKILYLTLMIVTIFSLFFTLLILLFTNSFISIFTNDQTVIAVSASYLKIIAFSYFVTALTVLFSTILKSMGEVKLPLYISVLAIGLNTLLNYLLIFGHFGFEEMGVEGAAIATVLARTIQTVLLFLLVRKYLSLSLKSFNLKDSFDFPLLKSYFVITVPSILNHALWTVGETAHFWVYSQMGTDQLAAVTLIDPLLFFFMALFIGLADASTVMIGNNIGQGKEDSAFDYSKRFLKLTLGLSIVSSIGVILIAPAFISIYNVSDKAANLAGDILIVYSVILTVRMLNMVNNVGVLRAGGDTKFVMYLDVIGIWLIGLPLAAAGAFVFDLPIYIVFALANSHEFARAYFGIKRTLSKKWINNVVTIPIKTKRPIVTASAN